MSTVFLTLNTAFYSQARMGMAGSRERRTKVDSKTASGRRRSWIL